jgi:hypothetical protein
MLGQGRLELPIGPAYVHTVVSSSHTSFKLGSGLGATGAMDTDEMVAIAGTIGRKARMIPMKITVDWPGEGRSQSFNYEVCQHNNLTPALVRYLISDAAIGWHDLPEQHTVVYDVSVEFDKLGTYTSSNIASGRSISPAISDATRPIFALLNNPLGEPAKINSVDVRMTVKPQDASAEVLELRLDGKTYRPGETVTGRLIVQPWRQDRHEIPVKFTLPQDMPEGEHQLQACDAMTSLVCEQARMPHRFEPQTTAELFDALKHVVSTRGDRLYLRLELGQGGLAIDSRELPQLPPSRAVMLSESAVGKVQPFGRSVVEQQDVQYVLTGSAAARFTVTKEASLRTQDQKGNE